jgi:hypothetical protein
VLGVHSYFSYSECGCIGSVDIVDKDNERAWKELILEGGGLLFRMDENGE